MKIFITGSTGFLGKQFLHKVIQDKNTTVYVALRRKKGQSLDDKLAQLGVVGNPRVIPVELDIAEGTCDLSLLPEKIDEFWHIAGLTDFHESKRAQLFKVNVEGTKKALELAAQMRVQRFFYISTAYVSGIYDGLVMEDGLLPSPKFRNPYEESKYAAEKAVRESGLPYIVLRPSIIVGDSKTGEVGVDKMVYGVAKTYHLLTRLLNREYRDRGGIPAALKYYVKGDPAVQKNLVCVDDVVNLMVAVRLNGELGKTYHCVNPTTVTVGQLHNAIVEWLEVDFLAMQVNFRSLTDRKQKIIDHGVGAYAGYMLNSDPIFDLSNCQALNSALPTPMDEAMVRFLFAAYLQKLSDKANHKEILTTLDLERLVDVKKYGGFTLAYETMSRQLETFRIPETPGYLAYTIVDNTAIMVSDPLSSTCPTHASITTPPHYHPHTLIHMNC